MEHFSSFLFLTVIYFFCISEYKTKFYNNLTEVEKKNDRTISQYTSDYSDDFAIISDLIEKIAENGEQFDAKPLFPVIVSNLEEIFKSPGNPPAFPNGSHDGLRVIFFLVLQLVIIWKSEDFEKDLSGLWRVYTKFLKNEKQEPDNVPYEGKQYCHLAHHVLNLAVGFQNDPVSITDSNNNHTVSSETIILLTR